MVESLLELKKLEIGECEPIEEIVSTGREGDMLLFPKLEILKLYGLKKLKRFRRVNSVECNEVETSITNDASAGDLKANTSALFDENVVFPNLKELELWKINQVNMIWGKEFHQNYFSTLKDLSVKICGSLETLFTASVASALQQLEKLIVQYCVMMWEIVSWEEDCSPRFVLKVTSLELETLPRLEGFYLGHDHISDWPSLKQLIVHDCHKIDLFDPRQHLNIQQDATFAKIISNLEKYSFRREDMHVTYKSSSGKLHIECPELILGDGSKVFPIALLQTFQHLEKLEVHRSCLDQILFPREVVGDGMQAKTLARIQRLELFDLRNMTYIWSEHTQSDQILRNLKSLYVDCCECLISLAPSTALFKNLTHLAVHNCGQLTKLLTFSNGRSLVNLTNMEVTECKSLTGIIVADDDEEDSSKEDKNIVFRELEELKLESLKSLTSFCSARNCNFKFPSLHSVVVQHCRNMAFFSHGDSTPPLFKEL